MDMDEVGNNLSREDEYPLSIYPKDFVDRLKKMAADIQKTLQEIIQSHSVVDVKNIHSDLVPVISQTPSLKKTATHHASEPSNQSHHGTRGNHWTEDEHKSFIEGLNKYGKGDWKSISRHMRTRTPTQVASHAQKYFNHLKSINANKERRRRPSIHDVTHLENGNTSAHQLPVIGQTSNPTPGLMDYGFETVIPEALMNLGPMSYPMQHPYTPS